MVCWHKPSISNAFVNKIKRVITEKRGHNILLMRDCRKAEMEGGRGDSMTIYDVKVFSHFINLHPIGTRQTISTRLLKYLKSVLRSAFSATLHWYTY